MAANVSYAAKRVTSGTTTIKSGPGVLGNININKTLTGTVTISDGTTTIGVLTNGTTSPLGTVFFGGPDGGLSFGTSLIIACSATEDVTIFYR